MKVAVAGKAENVKNYIAALDGVGLEGCVTLSIEDTKGFAGLLLPGGGDVDPALYGEETHGSEGIDRDLDDRQLALADVFLRSGRPVLGICKGHQIINLRFGGSLIQDLATAEAHKYHQADSIHPCVNLDGALMAQLYGRRHIVNSSHHQGLGRIGEGLRVISFAEDGTVESIAHDDLPVLGVQWHPERMCFSKARPDTADGEPVFRWFRAQMELRR